MRQQESGRTRQWIEQTASHTYITQATSYHGSSDGNYREAKHAEVRQVARVDWNDLTRLIEGEAIVLFGGRRIYTRLFQPEIDDSGPKRLSRGVMLQPPKAEKIRASHEGIRAIAKSIQDGAVVAGAADAPSPNLQAMIAAFRDAANAGATAEACSQAALAAVCELPAEAQPISGCPNDSSDGVPVTQFSPMLDAASRQQIGGAKPEGKPSEPIDAALLESIASCEALGSVGELAARAIALRIIGERDQALREIAIVEPPAMTPDELVHRIGVMHGLLEQMRSQASPLVVA